MTRTITFTCLLAAAALLWQPSARAQQSEFTYQGRLQQSGQAYTGTADLVFRLYDQAAGGSQVGPTVSKSNWPVSDGLFQVDLDFGAAAFDGQPRYLEVLVDGTALSPRQAVRPAPVALFALAGNEGPQGPQGDPGPAGPQGPEGPEGASPFVLNQATGELSYQTSGMLLRFLPTGGGGRISMGSSHNQAAELGAVALGGSGSSQANIAGNFFATVGGGSGNSALGDRSTVSGGSSNQAGGSGSFIGGGYDNVTEFSASTVSGGNTNSATRSYASVAGGRQNLAAATAASVGGGESNQANSNHATVGGGLRNTASGVAAAVSGGRDSTAAGSAASVAGGVLNCAGGNFSLAAGRRAKVRPGTNSGSAGTGCDGVEDTGTTGGDAGTFVWADSQNADFTSSGSDQFLIRAAGGVGINTRDLKGALTIQGATPQNPSFGQFHIRSEETTGAAGTGTGIVLIGHNGQFHSNLGAIQFYKENGTVGNSRAGMRVYVRGTGVQPSERMRIDSNGVTYNTSGSWSTFSDRRLKKNIEAIGQPLESLLALEGVRFEYRDPDQVLGAEGPRLGFIAQQVEEVFPEWVGENEDGYKHVTPTGFEALTVEALRELEARVRAQGERAGRLEAQLATQAVTVELMLAANRELSSRNAELLERLALLADGARSERMLTGSQP